MKELNTALKRGTPELRQKLSGKLIEKQKREGKKAITEADRRRWVLPFGVPPSGGSGEPAKAGTPNEWREWEAPFDTDPDWPKPLQDALTAYRAAWRAKMDDVNGCIAANAEMEELVDKPEIVSGTIRVAGLFTMEGVIAVEDGFDTPIAGAPYELETFEGRTGVALVSDFAENRDRRDAGPAFEPQNIEAHLERFCVCSKPAAWISPATRT